MWWYDVCGCMWCNWSLQCQFMISFSSTLEVLWRLQATYIPLVVTSGCTFQTRSLPREGLAKAENIRNAPIISISRLDSGLPARLLQLQSSSSASLSSDTEWNWDSITSREHVSAEKKTAKATAKAIFQQKSKREGILRSKTHPA